MWQFIVPGQPQGKGRPRVTKHGTFTPPKTKAYMQLVHASARAVIRECVAGPIRVDILAVLGRPKRLCRVSDPDGFIWAPVKPDQDNIRKVILDALNLGIIVDDAQVVSGETLKVYAEKGGKARVMVTICKLPPVTDKWLAWPYLETDNA